MRSGGRDESSRSRGWPGVPANARDAAVPHGSSSAAYGPGGAAYSPGGAAYGPGGARYGSGRAHGSAAELRELAELADLLNELAGLVRDLGALVVGLLTAAATATAPAASAPAGTVTAGTVTAGTATAGTVPGGTVTAGTATAGTVTAGTATAASATAGTVPAASDMAASATAGLVRTFAVPPELAELAAAYQELSAGQRSLRDQFDAAAPGQDRAGLRASLAALTERATRAVAAAAAVTFPGVPSVPPSAAAQPSRAPATSRGAAVLSENDAAAPPQAPSPEDHAARLWRQETDVHTSPAGSAPGSSGEPVRAADRRLAPVAVALDAPDIDVAARWATLVTPYVSTVKIGLELYLRYGPAVVATVRGGSGVHVFLDLKLHDIPNTVAAAARAVTRLRPEILTVHAAGGAEMIRAAVEAAPDTIVAGVTLLTSIGDRDLHELGIDGSASDAVRRMAALAVAAGARGLVCSPQEVAAVRAEVGPDILLITPGIRLAGATSDDQARIATPEEALKAGADLLVIGRPITRAADPGAAAAAIATSLRRATPPA